MEKGGGSLPVADVSPLGSVASNFEGEAILACFGEQDRARILLGGVEGGGRRAQRHDGGGTVVDCGVVMVDEA